MLSLVFLIGGKGEGGGGVTWDMGWRGGWLGGGGGGPLPSHLVVVRGVVMWFHVPHCYVDSVSDLHPALDVKH